MILRSLLRRIGVMNVRVVPIKSQLAAISGRRRRDSMSLYITALLVMRRVRPKGIRHLAVDSVVALE